MPNIERSHAGFPPTHLPSFLIFCGLKRPILSQITDLKPRSYRNPRACGEKAQNPCQKSSRTAAVLAWKTRQIRRIFLRGGRQKTDAVPCSGLFLAEIFVPIKGGYPMAPVTYDGTRLGLQEVGMSDLADAVATAFEDERVEHIRLHRIQMKEKREFDPGKFKTR